MQFTNLLPSCYAFPKRKNWIRGKHTAHITCVFLSSFLIWPHMMSVLTLHLLMRETSTELAELLSVIQPEFKRWSQVWPQELWFRVMLFAKHTVSLSLIMWLVWFCCCYCFETESQCVDQAGLELCCLSVGLWLVSLCPVYMDFL